jgi:hypothetical protein
VPANPAVAANPSRLRLDRVVADEVLS